MSESDTFWSNHNAFNYDFIQSLEMIDDNIMFLCKQVGMFNNDSNFSNEIPLEKFEFIPNLIQLLIFIQRKLKLQRIEMAKEKELKSSRKNINKRGITSNHSKFNNYSSRHVSNSSSSSSSSSSSLNKKSASRKIQTLGIPLSAFDKLSTINEMSHESMISNSNSTTMSKSTSNNGNNSKKYESQTQKSRRLRNDGFDSSGDENEIKKDFRNKNGKERRNKKWKIFNSLADVADETVDSEHDIDNIGIGIGIGISDSDDDDDVDVDDSHSLSGGSPTVSPEASISPNTIMDGKEMKTDDLLSGIKDNFTKRDEPEDWHIIDVD